MVAFRLQVRASDVGSKPGFGLSTAAEIGLGAVTRAGAESLRRRDEKANVRGIRESAT